MGANKPIEDIEDIEATLLADTKSALDELVWWAHATMANRCEDRVSPPMQGSREGFDGAGYRL